MIDLQNILIVANLATVVAVLFTSFKIGAWFEESRSGIKAAKELAGEAKQVGLHAHARIDTLHEILTDRK